MEEALEHITIVKIYNMVGDKNPYKYISIRWYIVH